MTITFYDFIIIIIDFDIFIIDDFLNYMALSKNQWWQNIKVVESK